MKDKLKEEMDKCFNEVPMTEEMIKVRQRILSYIEDNVVHVASNYFKVKDNG